MEGCFGIGTAVAILRHGGSVARSKWLSGEFLYMEDGKVMFSGFAYEDDAPWLAESEDLLADDYVEVP